MLLYGENKSNQEIGRYFAPKGSPKEIAEIIAEWSKFFFGDPEQTDHYHIRKDVPEFHKAIYEDLSCDIRLYYITTPSEFGKTTICTLIYPLYRVFYYNEPYIVICSRNDDVSRELLDEIKNELRYNDKLKEVYGALLPIPDDKKVRYKKKDASNIIELENGSTIRCIPVGGQVRGRKRKGRRITLLIVDDAEEIEDLDSQVIPEKNKRWLRRSAVPRMDKELGKARVVGTRIGEGCTIDYVMNHPAWQGKVYRALVPDGVPWEQKHSIWESRWSTEFLQKERQNAIDANEYDDWLFERQNEPPKHLKRNLSGYSTYQGMFERKNEQNLLWLDGWLDPIPVNTYHAIDPAFGQAKSSDPRSQVTFASGLLPTRISTTGELHHLMAIWVLEYDYDYKDPDTVIERALELHKEYFYRSLVVEAIGGQKIYEFIAEKAAQKDPFLLKYPLQTEFVNYHERGKEDRIYQRFKTYNKLGQFFVRPEHKQLRFELDSFLHAGGLHILDAIEMGCRYVIPSQEEVYVRDKAGRHYQEAERDELKDRLAREGKSYLLW